MAIEKNLTPHAKKVFALLTKSTKPLTAYEILHKLSSSGIKAPPTVYRALDNLMTKKMIHRIQSLNAFVACDADEIGHEAQFAVCKSCGTVEEIHDSRISNYIKKIGKDLNFRVESEIFELSGICAKCDEA
jgi:Fur family transcriptional regulator, zinc uptake regulator